MHAPVDYVEIVGRNGAKGRRGQDGSLKPEQDMDRRALLGYLKAAVGGGEHIQD